MVRHNLYNLLHSLGIRIFEAASRGGSGCEGERWLRSKLSQLGCDVSCFRKLIHTPYRPECRVGIREPSDETPERPTRSLRGTRERERTRLRLVNFLRWSSHPTAIGRYMKACRAPSTCHKATEENLSRIDTLAWSYPKADWPLQTCMSRHHNAGCHPRGHSYTEEGGASPVPGGSWLAQVPCPSAPSPTRTPRQRERWLTIASS